MSLRVTLKATQAAIAKDILSELSTTDTVSVDLTSRGSTGNRLRGDFIKLGASLDIEPVMVSRKTRLAESEELTSLKRKVLELEASNSKLSSDLNASIKSGGDGDERRGKKTIQALRKRTAKQ
jgi:hypothetical protein